MIENERQWEVTTRKLAEMRAALDEAQKKLSEGSEVPDRVRQAHINGILALIGDMEAELAEYEKLRTGRVRSLAFHSLEELPSVLVRARIARGWTHKDLAQALGTARRQVQKDEAGGYQKANLQKLSRVAGALELSIQGRAKLRTQKSRVEIRLEPKHTESG